MTPLMHVPTTAGLIWRPVVSPLWIAAMAMLLIGLALFAYVRSYRLRPAASVALLTMRLLLVAMLIALLMGPSRLPPQHQSPGRTMLTVLLDVSQSMLTDDVEGQPRIRYAIERWLNAEMLHRLSEQFEVRLVAVGDSVRTLAPSLLSQPIDELAEARVSRLVDGVTQTLLDVNPQGDEAMLLMLSDGRDTDEQPYQPVGLLARSRRVPVHTVTFGGQTVVRDVAVVARPRQEYLLAGEGGEMMVEVVQAGLDGASTTLHVTDSNGRGRDFPVEFSGRRSVAITVPIRQDQPGLYEYTLAVDAAEGERTLSNNSQSLFFEVTAKRIQVLVLEGEPYWETKFIAQSLRKDGHVELTQMTGMKEGRPLEIITTRQDATPRGLPSSAEQWASYDVVVLGRGLQRILDEKTAEQMVRFVTEHGGHVVLSRGRPYDPDTPGGRALAQVLGVLEPVVWTRGLERDVKLSLTAAGRTSPSFMFPASKDAPDQIIAQLPGFTVMHPIEKAKPLALVLAVTLAGGDDTASKPGLVSMNVGRGRVFAVLGEGLWQWSLLPPEKKQYDGVYDAFWSNTVRWLAMGGGFKPGEQVSLRLNRTAAKLGDEVMIEAVARVVPDTGFHPRLIIVDPDGQRTDLTPRNVPGNDARRQVTYKPEQPGVYTVLLETPAMNPATQERKFSVYEHNTERLLPSANTAGLRQLADASGGLFVPYDQPQRLLEQLTLQQALRAAPPEPIYVWDRGLILFALLTWAGVEWLGRRMAGLL